MFTQWSYSLQSTSCPGERKCKLLCREVEFLYFTPLLLNYTHSCLPGIRNKHTAGPLCSFSLLQVMLPTEFQVVKQTSERWNETQSLLLQKTQMYKWKTMICDKHHNSINSVGVESQNGHFILAGNAEGLGKSSPWHWQRKVRRGLQAEKSEWWWTGMQVIEGYTYKQKPLSGRITWSLLWQ